MTSPIALHRGSPVDVQIVLNAVNANTAAIGLGYAQGILQTYNLSLAGRGVRLQTSSTSSAPAADSDIAPRFSTTRGLCLHGSW